MKKLLLAAALVLMPTADALAQCCGQRAPYYQRQRGPNPLDFFGAFLNAIPMIAPPPAYYQPPPPPYYQQPPQYQPQPTYVDPRDPNLYLEEYRVTKQEVEAAMQQYCSDHPTTIICRKIGEIMRRAAQEQRQ
jgi:hypothetical protein